MIIFWIKEAFKLIGRAKSSFFLSLISTSISVILITASLISIQLSNRFQNKLKRNISINIFLKDSLPGEAVNKLHIKLKNTSYVNTCKYIDKKEAADLFVKETGEDFRKILDYNPLPSSFLVTLKEGYVDKDSLNNIISSFSKLEGVDDVVFQQEFVYKLLSFLNKIKKYIFIITAILFFISLYLVYSTIKLITRSKYEEMETMKLVGAKLSTIKMPVVLNSILIGLFAGLISFAVFFVVFYYFNNLIDLHQFLEYKNGLYIVVLFTLGPLIGIMVSLFSLRKINLNI
jgi:cell division transport system permease protein